jgi:hypothetical protein
MAIFFAVAPAGPVRGPFQGRLGLLALATDFSMSVRAVGSVVPEAGVPAQKTSNMRRAAGISILYTPGRRCRQQSDILVPFSSKADGAQGQPMRNAKNNHQSL